MQRALKIHVIHMLFAAPPHHRGGTKPCMEPDSTRQNLAELQSAAC